MEERVQFLVDLLEKCKNQLGEISEAEAEPAKNENNSDIIDQMLQKEPKPSGRGREIFEDYKRHIMAEDKLLHRQHRKHQKQRVRRPRNNASLDSLSKVKRQALTSD
mmetsp:Transcript_38333/g.37849  ORF Transcript_38333/g.37849 Transcript_38333/m.37849 type:complete len:107 (+) Transcript_38333:170-490(+)